MISTESKISTLRKARAQAVLCLPSQLVEVLRSRSGPKGDALEIARAAGVLAAKRTWELIPYCHPIPIDQVLIHYELEENAVRVTSEVTSVGKTGIEMEALVAAQIAATTIFDMLKPLGTEMVITEVKVLEKEGGKSSFREKLPPGFKAAVIVTSDGTFAGEREDRSGKIIQERLEQFGIPSPEYLILPDEKDKIQQALLYFHKKDFSLVLTTGGTGLGPRDVTVEATEAILDREVPGIMEAARAFGQQRTPYSMLSRGRAGLKGKMLIVNLPGSSKGTAESLDAIFPAILHSYRMMVGGKHD
jgi:molybdenum cofactor biosynthesis protein MoaC